MLDAGGTNRQPGASKEGQIFRSADDPNEVVVLFERDLEQARQFHQPEELSAKMHEAGVLGSPEPNLLEEIEQVFRRGKGLPVSS